MDVIFTLRVRIADDSDVMEIIERARRGFGAADEAWFEVLDMLENHELPEDALTVEDVEIIR